MMCELCGKSIERGVPTEVEGSVLEVCRDCASFGKPVKTRKGGGAGYPSPPGDSSGSNIEANLQRRFQRMRGKDIYDKADLVLADDFNRIIRKGRQAKGWSQKDLANNINEKKSVIAKLEKSDMRPDEALRKKLEKALNIRLLDELPEPVTQSKRGGGALTIGDLILMSKKDQKQK